MEIPPISEQEVEQEWVRLQNQLHLVEAQRYIARNMVMIQKCFGERAYHDAYEVLRRGEHSARLSHQVNTQMLAAKIASWRRIAL